MIDDRDEGESVPTYYDDDGIERTPLAFQIIADRTARIRALTRDAFARARHRGSRR